MEETMQGKLLCACIIGGGLEHSLQPEVFLGGENKGYSTGAILDANKIVELIDKAKEEIYNGTDAAAIDALNEVINSLHLNDNSQSYVTKLDNLLLEFSQFKSAYEDAELVIAAALNDLNERVETLEA